MVCNPNSELMAFEPFFISTSISESNAGSESKCSLNYINRLYRRFIMLCISFAFSTKLLILSTSLFLVDFCDIISSPFSVSDCKNLNHLKIGLSLLANNHYLIV